MGVCLSGRQRSTGGGIPFGNYPNEKILLNEETIWQGRNHNQNSIESMYIIEDIRNLLWQNKYHEAQEKTAKEFLCYEISPRAFQPLGYLHVNYRMHPQSAIKSCTRNLSMNRGLAVNEIKTTDGYHIRQEVFSSFPDNMAVVHISSIDNKKLSMDLSLDRYDCFHTRAVGNDILIIDGQAEDERMKKSPGYNPVFKANRKLGTSFTGAIRALSDGQVKSEAATLHIENVTHLYLFYVASTDYNADNPYIP